MRVFGVEKESNMNEWKDLDIDNLPDRFFTRDDIEIDHNDKDIEWLVVEGKNNRHLIVGNIVKGYKYRYRLKPLEPIRITAKIARDLLLMKTEYDRAIKPISEELEQMYGRKVEIID